MESRKLQATIMRRVYYSYLLSVVTHSMFWQGMFLGVASLLLARWLHVASIIQNFLSVPVGQVPQHTANAVFGAVNHGEVLMVLTFVLALVIATRVGYQLAHVVFLRTRLIPRM